MPLTDLIYKLWPDVDVVMNKAVWTAGQVFLVTVGADWADWANTELLQKAVMAAAGAAIVVVKEAVVQWRDAQDEDDLEDDMDPEDGA